MKSLLSLLALVVALGAPAQAIIVPVTAGNRASNAPIKVAPGNQASNGDVTVGNGNFNGSYPMWSDSTGSATITPGGANNPDSTATTVRLANGFQGRVDGFETGDTVQAGPNGTGTMVGTGGTVALGSGASFLIINVGAQGSPYIHVTFPGGSSVDIPAGGAAICNG